MAIDPSLHCICNIIFSCLFSVEAFRTAGEVQTFLKRITNTTVLCSLSVTDLITFMDMKRDQYIDKGQFKLFHCAEYIGLQQDGTLVFSHEVKMLSLFTSSL